MACIHTRTHVDVQVHISKGWHAWRWSTMHQIHTPFVGIVFTINTGLGTATCSQCAREGCTCAFHQRYASRHNAHTIINSPQLLSPGVMMRFNILQHTSNCNGAIARSTMGHSLWPMCVQLAAEHVDRSGIRHRWPAHKPALLYSSDTSMHVLCLG